jgi:hypothetical protein
MYCRKCDGPVYHDRMYNNDSFIDLSCLMCGKRWHLKKDHVLARLILEQEKKESIFS